MANRCCVQYPIEGKFMDQVDPKKEIKKISTPHNPYPALDEIQFLKSEAIRLNIPYRIHE